MTKKIKVSEPKERYEIAVERNNIYGYDLDYIGPWGIDKSTSYSDFMEALYLIDEWGLNSKGEIRTRNKIGIYDYIDDKFYTDEHCLSIVDIINRDRR